MDVTILDVAPAQGFEPTVGLLLGILESGTRKWRSELGRVSKERVIWQPFPNGHSIGAVILHIADVEAYWLHEVTVGRKLSAEEEARLLTHSTRQYDIQWPQPPPRPLAWFFEQHDAIRARTREIVASLEGTEQTFPQKRRAFTLRWLLHHVIHHEAYHGGQAVLLSLMHAAGR